METSDDELRTRLDGNIQDDDSLRQGAEDVNGNLRSRGGQLVQNSTPKNRFLPRANDDIPRPGGSPLLLPNRQSMFSSPSAMNRSFPRPTQSISPEFPLEPKRDTSPEDSTFSVGSGKKANVMAFVPKAHRAFFSVLLPAFLVKSVDEVLMICK